MTDATPSTAAAVAGSPQPAGPVKSGPVKRQAVLIIHGMGEQTPMETIREFADSVWKKDITLHFTPTSQTRDGSDLFFVPDPNAGSRELRKISTRRSADRVAESGDGRTDSVRTDFFELYWADATHDSKWSDFAAWFWRLLLRRPQDAPKDVRGIWYGLWIITALLIQASATVILWFPLQLGEPSHPYALALLGSGAVLAIGGHFTRGFPPPWVANWMLIGGLALAVPALVFLIAYYVTSALADITHPFALVVGCLIVTYVIAGALTAFLVSFFGDVARYCLNTPGNVAVRKEVRDRGIALVERLTETPQYERIILAGHSLGTIVAYDILTLLWADYVSSLGEAQASAPEVQPDSPLQAALDECVTAIETLSSVHDKNSLKAFRHKQRTVFKHLRAPPKGERAWLISDLVTIACPLTHAEILLARNASELQCRFKRRELATCPPAMESGSKQQTWRLTYKDITGASPKTRLIHDAVFAAVRWSNIHDKPKGFFLTGDIISGPVGKLFGRRDSDTVISGIADVAVEPTHDGTSLPKRLFTHTQYWDPRDCPASQTGSVKAVRQVLNLLDVAGVDDALVELPFCAGPYWPLARSRASGVSTSAKMASVPRSTSRT